MLVTHSMLLIVVKHMDVAPLMVTAEDSIPAAVTEPSPRDRSTGPPLSPARGGKAMQVNTNAWPLPSQQMVWLARTTGPQLSEPDVIPSKHRPSPCPISALANFLLTTRCEVSVWIRANPGHPPTFSENRLASPTTVPTPW